MITSNYITICNIDDKKNILDIVNEELKTNEVVVIESEVADNSESSDCACHSGNEDQQNNSESMIDSGHFDLGSDVDSIELDALQEDDLKLLQTLLREILNGSSSILFLHSKLDLLPSEIKDVF